MAQHGSACAVPPCSDGASAPPCPQAKEADLAKRAANMEAANEKQKVRLGTRHEPAERARELFHGAAAGAAARRDHERLQRGR